MFIYYTIFKLNSSVHLSVYQLVSSLFTYFDMKETKVEFCRRSVRRHSCSYRNNHQLALLANKVVVVIQSVAMLPSVTVYMD